MLLNGIVINSPLIKKMIMKKSLLTILVLALTWSMGYSQNAPVDFEQDGNGSQWSWIMFENDDNAPLDIVENPDISGLNTSLTVAKFTAKVTGQPWAGTTGDGIGPFVFDETNRIVKIMVWKSVISNVGIKFETASGWSEGEINVANTKVNEWEELVFDFSGRNNPPEGEQFNGISVFPDFNMDGRTTENVIYFDNIAFSGEQMKPESTIAAAKALEDGTVVTIKGVAITDALESATRTSFYIQDHGVGINIFKFGTPSKEIFLGDSVIVTGSLATFRSLREIVVTDIETDIAVINSGNMVPEPREISYDQFVNAVSPATDTYNIQGSLVRINGLTTDPASWPQDLAAASANVNLTYTMNGNTIPARLLVGTEVIGATPPSNLDIIGVVGAFDVSQIFPRYTTDLVATSAETSPSMPAPMPFAEEFNVLSVYSDAYPGLGTVNINPGWGQATVFAEIQIEGNNTIELKGLNYQGIEFGQSVDVSGMDVLHLDYWTVNSSTLEVFLISPGPVETPVPVGVPTTGWGSANIPLSLFDPVDLANVFQMKIVGDGDVYIDNIFFETEPVPPTFYTMPITFEEGLDWSGATVPFDGAEFSIVDNPDMVTINPSEFAGKLVKRADGQPWAGVFFDLDQPLDLWKNPNLSMMVKAPKADAPVLFKVENRFNPAEFYELEIPLATANEWVNMEFNLSQANRDIPYNRIVIIFDRNMVGDGTDASTWYLDNIKYGDLVNVNFRIDMSDAIAKMNFNPELHAVTIAGDFNGWNARSDTLFEGETPGIFERAFELSQGHHEFKFVYTSHQYQVFEWDLNENRTIEITESMDTEVYLPILSFDDYTNVIFDDIAVYFQVNMENEILEGDFNPETDIVELRGSFNGWHAGTQMTPTDVPSIYETLVFIDQYAVPNELAYKFTFVNESEMITWEYGEDHILPVDVDETYPIEERIDGKYRLLAAFNETAPMFVGMPIFEFNSVRDLNTYPEGLTSLEQIAQHPLVGQEVTFTAVVVSNPRNSGLSSINVENGMPYRIHVFVVDTLAIEYGIFGMGMQVVETSGTAAFDNLENAHPGDVLQFTGALTFFNNQAQFDPTDNGIMTIETNAERFAPLMKPVMVNASDLQMFVDGTLQAKLEMYSYFVNQRVRIDGAEIAMVNNENVRPSAVLAQGGAMIQTNSMFFRYRNDGSRGYSNVWNYRRETENPFFYPPQGTYVNLTGFLAFDGFDSFGLSADALNNTFSIHPENDGIVWVNDAMSQIGQNDLEILGLVSPNHKFAMEHTAAYSNGGYFMMPITLQTKMDEEVSSVEFSFQYPAELVLEDLSFDNSIFAKLGWDVVLNDEGGYVSIAAAGATPFAGYDTLGVIYGYTAESAMVGEAYDIFFVNAMVDENDNMDDYAIVNGSVYIEDYVPPVLGDVSMNGSVKAFDASLILKALVDAVQLTDEQLSVADVTDDMTISALDASVILQYVVGLVQELPYIVDQPTKSPKFINESLVLNSEATEVAIPFTVSEVSTIFGFESQLTYNPNYLTFKGIDWSDNLSGYMKTVSDNAGVLSIAGAGVKSTLTDGSFGTLRFELNKGWEEAVPVVSIDRLRWNEGTEMKAVGNIEISPITTGLVEAELPTEFMLEQNFPNPFNPSTTVRFALPQASDVHLTVFNALGQTVAVLVNQPMNAGNHTVQFDASKLSSGMYFYRINAGNYTKTMKMMLVK